MALTTAPPQPPQTQQPEPVRRRRALLNRLDLKVSPYLYILPFFVVFAIFGAYPMFRTLYMSFYDWDLANARFDPPVFIGLENYKRMLTDSYYWNAMRNTFGVFLLATIPQLALALLIAAMLNRPLLRGRTFFRLAILLPNATSVTAVGIIFLTLFKDTGVINWALGLVGIGPIDWHGSGGFWSYWTAVATMVDWRWTGYNALILLAGMLAIPRDLYESAAIDGAGPWRQFWSVTFPMLRPTFLFVTIVSIVGGLQLFTEPVIYTYGYTVRGGDAREVQTLTMYMYENSMVSFNNAGYGAAISWSLFLLIIMASIGNFLLIRRTAR